MRTAMDLVDALDQLDHARTHLIAMVAYVGDIDVGCEAEATLLFRSLAQIERRLTAQAVAEPTR